jgi:UDP-N-acetylglucosamine/UDP-N-acetyl-alpha-D-glucosaminouronate 4-epimerase
VTGGGGFIGSHLVDALLEHGHDVRVIDNFSTGNRRNLLHLDSALEIVEADIRSLERVLHAAKGCDIVFHLAALPSVPRSVQDPLTSSEVNVTGTLNVLLAAREAGVRCVVYSSSSSVYGANKAAIRREADPVVPISPYGVSKLAGEAYCRSMHEVYGFETVALRYFNVFGPRQDPGSEYAAVVPNFISAALLAERPVVFGDGEQTRDFTYVRNVVDANLLAAVTDGIAGETFNIGCGKACSVNRLLTLVCAASGCALQPRFEPSRPGDIRDSVADVSKASRIMSYEPSFSLAEGLRATYEWVVSEPTLLPRIDERRRWIALAS